MSDEQNILNETAASLAGSNPGTADAYRQAAPSILARHGADAFSELSRRFTEIAGTGWKATESVDVYVELTALDIDTEVLLHIGEVGLVLTGYSFEPSANYFRAVRQLENAGRLEKLKGLETSGLAIQRRYSHASGLQSDFFRMAGELISKIDSDEYTAWLDLVAMSVPAPREQLARLLDSHPALVEISWLYLRQLQVVGEASADVYLANFPEFISTLNQAQRAAVEAIFTRFASADLNDLVACLPPLFQLAEDHALGVLEHAEMIKHLPVLACFIQHASFLPLDRPHIVSSWLSSGLEETAGNLKAMVAWVAIESARSFETLRALEGQVRFDDHSRVFDLLAEAVSGRKMLVTAEDGDPEFRVAVAENQYFSTSDGKTITLPNSVNLFDDENDNFGFYKISLFHQLGYMEFGCFSAITRIREFLETFEDSRLAERLFLIAEDSRIDWQLHGRYPGARGQLARQKDMAWTLRKKKAITRSGQLMETMIATGLDKAGASHVDDPYRDEAEIISQQMMRLKAGSSTVNDAIEVMSVCYDIIKAGLLPSALDANKSSVLLHEEFPEPIAYRGELDVESVESTMKVEAILEALGDDWQSEPDQVPMAGGMIDPENMEIEDLEKGETGEGAGVMIEELAREIEIDISDAAGSGREELIQMLGGIGAGAAEAAKHHYDEWDYQIGDYRPRWCTLLEHKELDSDEEYVRRTLVEHEVVARRLRNELNKVRPEMLRKVRGVQDGEELDLERTVTYFVDRKAGFRPDENIYVQRQRRDRDVSTLFLLDMSASTDDIIHDPDAAPVLDVEVDDDEYLVEYFRQRKDYEDAARRIIDLEKESVILMSEALEKLGDAYSVCGFSGYGREQVDYYVCKDFDEPLDSRTRGRIGGIRPCRSTRMGAPIRHGTKRLLETGSRIKAMIIISDGYPQDHDYGTDRNSRDYGLMDTMKALVEAKQQGVLTYCLTVDPSGHDYLREMCPDSQYMVIQDINQLPEELSRVYRTLTG